MYYPYFRGKRHELNAIGHIITAKIQGVRPIIEPVKVGITAPANLPAWVKNNMALTLIVNPAVGDYIEDEDGLDEVIDIMRENARAHFGYLVTTNSPMSEIDAFVEAFPEHNKTLIHTQEHRDVTKLSERTSGDESISHTFFSSGVGEEYHESFPERNSVLIEDGFRRVTPNASYPPEQAFSSLPFRYSKKGYEGFGDFLIVGDHYSDGGGNNANCVAIHITFERKNPKTERPQIATRHFLSDTIDESLDVGGKFLEAAAHLVAITGSDSRFVDSKGITAFRRLYAERHNPGLGKVKEHSMIHHLELMQSIVFPV